MHAFLAILAEDARLWGILAKKCARFSVFLSKMRAVNLPARALSFQSGARAHEQVQMGKGTSMKI